MKMSIAIPPISNSGFSFTRNYYDAMASVCKFYAGTKLSTIPYKQFQANYQKVDPTGDSKIRMMFPMWRNAGCIHPASSNGDVVLQSGSFLTQLGELFLKVSGLYYEAEDKVAQASPASAAEADDLLKKARSVYFGVAKIVFENLCETINGYEHLFWFVREYEPVTREEVAILLYVLEKTSPKEESIATCTCDINEVSKLMKAYRNGELVIKPSDKANNAISYFMGVLKTLLLVDNLRGSGTYTVSECGASYIRKI